MTEQNSPVISVIGESPVFLKMLERASKVAPLGKPVLVLGERGTGKELVAARLHYLSPRWEQPFIKLNCAALTETLLESELFGHEAGAFTGATGRHIGRFEQADGGTLFLDELAAIPLRMQDKILRVIEYGEFERVGGKQTIRVDVRLVGATNVDLPSLTKQGKFRADLLDRLAFEVITVPPLRARSEDILKLADYFALNMTRELGGSYFPGFSETAQRDLLIHDWPGNVRELKNVVERSVYRNIESESPIDELVLDPFASPFRLPLTNNADQGITAANEPSAQSFDGIDFKVEVARFEKTLIDKAMQEAQSNQRRAADLLGLSYHQLRALLRKYDLLEEYRRNRRTG
ncbi:MAG: phage shock protein operon transcriptional activator [Gammaproteobacteria bacterium]|nr:phage shock protein operon transcriptional activator [Gammaproteobacteria bacterium]